MIWLRLATLAPLIRAVRIQDREMVAWELHRVLRRSRLWTAALVGVFVSLAIFVAINGSFALAVMFVLLFGPGAIWAQVLSESGMREDVRRSQRLAPFVAASYICAPGSEHGVSGLVDPAPWLTLDKEPYVLTEATLYSACLEPSRSCVVLSSEVRHALREGDWLGSVSPDEDTALTVPAIGDSGWLFDADTPRWGRTRRLRVGSHRVEVVFDPSFRDALNVALMLEEMIPGRFKVVARPFPEMIETGFPVWNRRRISAPRTMNLARLDADGHVLLLPLADSDADKRLASQLAVDNSIGLWRTERSIHTEGVAVSGGTPRQVAGELARYLRQNNR